MILVLLGTQDKPFNRLLEAVEKEIIAGNIKEQVIVQAGFTNFKSKNMQIFDLIPANELSQLIEKSSLIITHGGVGSIIDSLSKNKIVIAAARLKEYGEHVNNHQKEIINEFVNEGYILGIDSFEKLNNILTETKNFIPKKYESNTKNMIKIIENYIEEESGIK